MVQTEIVLAGTVVNGAIVLTCSLATWKLLQFRNTVTQWNRQLNTLEQEWQQTLVHMPSTILEGPQQLKQGRRQWCQVQANVRLYYQWSQGLVVILQWVRSLKFWQRRTR